MQKVKLAVLALIAVFAFGAVMVASASALLPEFKTKSGKFPVSFTSESQLPLKPVSESFIETTGKKVNIVCEMSKGKGEIGSATEVRKILVDYTGCKEESALTKMCTTAGNTLGLIITSDIMAKVGYIAGTSKSKLGLEMLPETSGGAFTKFDCEGEAEEVEAKGCMLGEASPVNKLALNGTLLFLANAADNGPKYTELENGVFKPCELTGTAGFFKLGKGKSWSMDDALVTFSEEIELKG